MAEHSHVLDCNPDCKGWDDGMARSIAAEAYGLVHGKRAGTYGHPRKDFKIIAKVWTGLLQDLLEEGAELDEYRVAVLMTGLKLARLVKSPEHHDSRVDTIGYMLTMERLDEPADEELARADAAAVISLDTDGNGLAVAFTCSRCGHTGVGTVCDDWKCPGRDAAVDIAPVGVNPTDDEVARAHDVLARRQRIYDEEATTVFAKAPPNEVAQALAQLRGPQFPKPGS